MSPETIMRRCLRLAEKGRGSVEPNPMVGAAVVKGTRIFWGYHSVFGGPHAEIVALEKAGKFAKGATLYLTLEPCCHVNKKTPPCAPAVIATGIKKVVVATRDPNPAVSGKGIAQLRRAGIAVEEGLLQKEAQRMNAPFFRAMTLGLPLVTLKLAMSADGRIATKSGDSKWITSETARAFAHQLRSEHQAILVGTKTVVTDDPELTVRHVTGKNPIRIVVGDAGKLKPDAKIFDTSAARTILATHPNAATDAFEHRGVEVWRFEQLWKRIDLRELGKRLVENGITSLLVEGGSETAAEFLKAGLVDRVVFIIAPKIIGGRASVGAVGGEGVETIAHSIPLRNISISRIGDEVVYRADVGKV